MNSEWKQEMQGLTLEQLDAAYNALCEQVKAMGFIDLTDPPENWAELEAKKEYIFSLIWERANKH